MRVVKRVRGAKEYYSLQHSFRKGSRVITKERYMGTKVPKHVGRLEAAFLEEIKRETLHKQLEEIKRGFQREWKRYPASMKEKYKAQLAVEFTYNTNAIEGSTLTRGETEDLLQRGIAPRKAYRDVQETERHAALFIRILERPSTPSLPLLLEWHRELFSQTKPDIAGRLREYLVRVGPYNAPDWQDVPGLLKELFTYHRTRLHPVELAARIHYRFEKIHPFGDGNGRIGRLLMNSILWDAGYPVLIIEHKKRRSYYRAFQDEERFYKYFMRRYLAAHRQYLARARG